MMSKLDVVQNGQNWQKGLQGEKMMKSIPQHGSLQKAMGILFIDSILIHGK